MDEKMAIDRMDRIISEFAQHKQFNRFDLTMEALDNGAVKVILTDEKRPFDKVERIIHAHEDLSFIGDTFTYPNSFSPRSKMFATDGLKAVHFDSENYLIAEHEDGTVERFKVDEKHLVAVNDRLKLSLGGKYKPLIFKSQSQPKSETNPNFK